MASLSGLLIILGYLISGSNCQGRPIYSIQIWRFKGTLYAFVSFKKKSESLRSIYLFLKPQVTHKDAYLPQKMVLL